MRGSDVVDLITELLPRKVRRRLGGIVLLALLATGTFEAAALWYVEDKQAAILEDVVGPAMGRIKDGLILDSTP